MLYNFEWLQPGKQFPPLVEVPRLERYKQNAKLFDGDHFADPAFRTRSDNGPGVDGAVNMYLMCVQRISQVVGNFDDIISFPTLLNYQRLMSLKMADLVCGEYPTITGVTPKENAAIRDVRDMSDFDAKLFSTVLDVSRFGDAVWRIYKDYDGRMNFTCWTPMQWFPIVRQDGTNSVSHHCLAWIENKSTDPMNPDLYLNVQIHGTDKSSWGYYEQRVFHINSTGSIMDQVSSSKVPTGLQCCAVRHIRAFSTTTSVYGYDDYMPIDSILAEIMVRVGQISAILDKHADPNITGPVSMLSVDEETGEYRLKTGKFYAVSPGEEQPSYMTWDGQLSSAFKQLEFLINQLYILSEMGAALLGSSDGGSQAISGTAMRFKMVNPLAKARRIANSLTLPVRQLYSALSQSAEVEEADFEEGTEELVLPIPYRRISVFWADGLPDDPRENIENCKLATGETKMMPLEKGIMEFFGRSNEEAQQWVSQIREQSALNQAAAGFGPQADEEDDDDPNKPGPQDGTGVNPTKKGSAMGLNDFHGLQNK